MKKTMKQLLFSILMSCLALFTYAQQRTVTGTVTDDQGKTLGGVSYVVRGTTTGGVTTDDGTFSVVVNNNHTTIDFTSVGYKSQEVMIGTKNTLTVVLSTGEIQMEGVVVTALGIKREKKSLGYAIQEIKGESIVEAREPNIANALTGKVAGLQVIRSATGPAGSTKMVLRGYNSLTGNNQPLIVVDGVPVENFTGASNNDYWNPSLDMGSGIADINPEDIESLSVLKGPSAAALYGTRAGNGVILITTKSGRKQKGLGITITSSVGFESIFARPKIQNEFGQGTNGEYKNDNNNSWGPKVEGQMVPNWNNIQVPLTAYDNVGNYFSKPGITQNHGISFQQQIGGTGVYTSINRLEDNSMIPGAKLSRTNLMAKSISKFGTNDKWTLETKVQYTRAKANNRAIGGPNPTNGFYLMNMMPRTVDIREFKNGADALGNMIWWDSKAGLNPYWTNKFNLNEDIRDRFLLNGGLKYQFTEWLNAEVKGGADMFNTNNESRTYSGSRLTSTGRFGTGKQSFNETNLAAQLNALKDEIVGKLGVSAMLGGNLMARKSSYINASAGELVVPNLFSIGNSKGNPSVSQGFSEKRINSVYGSLGFNYDQYLFLDGTFRNDWTSALHKNNRSFFYPSVNLAYIFTDMFRKMDMTLPSFITYGKLRASYATVGNDMDPYQLYNYYWIGNDPRGVTIAGRNNTLYDPFVRSELIKNMEFGAELRFFKNRLGIDFTTYKSNATNQLINLAMDPLSGYEFRKINSGNIQNSGIELVVDGKIFTNPDGLLWNVTANYSTNKNKIVSIHDSVSKYGLGGYDDISIIAEEGKLYGEIYGTQYTRITDKTSPYFGQVLLSDQGLPTRDPISVYLGNQQPKAMIGLTNTFGYKGIVLSFQIDGRFGGKMFSGTLADMQQTGTSSMTVVNGARDKFVVDGYVYNSTSKTYEKNTKEVTPQQYWTATAGANNLGITERNMYDATNVRLRNIQLGYELPSKFLGRTGIQKAKVGLSCNNVWMIKSYMNGMDPESVFATGTNAVGFENGSAPTIRTILVNLALTF